MIATTTEPVPELDLIQHRLPWWTFLILAAGVIAMVSLLFSLTPMSGYVQFALMVIALYLIAQTITVQIKQGWRRAKNLLMTSLLVIAAALAVLPLVGILGYTISRGISRLDLTFLTHSMRGVAEQDPAGGAYHAIIGTLEQVGIATAIAAPFGILVAIYLVEYSSGRLGRFVSFFVDVMTGLPSIVAGLFIYTLWILTLHQNFSGFAGSLALMILMLPIVVRSAEEMLKLVPESLREAAYALGIPQWITVLRVVLPTALAGITTGIMLAIARIMGETAPVLLTVFGNQVINTNPFNGPQESLPLFVFTEAGASDTNAINRAWAGALTLIAIVLLLNLLARLLARLARTRG